MGAIYSCFSVAEGVFWKAARRGNGTLFPGLAPPARPPRPGSKADSFPRPCASINQSMDQLPIEAEWCQRATGVRPQRGLVPAIRTPGADQGGPPSHSEIPLPRKRPRSCLRLPFSQLSSASSLDFGRASDSFSFFPPPHFPLLAVVLFPCFPGGLLLLAGLPDLNSSGGVFCPQPLFF